MSFNKRILSAGAADLVPSENFSIVTYTGTGSSNSITGVGFQPDFVWIKRRNATDLNVLTDSVRGTDKQLFSNQTDAESVASTRLTSFDTNGFTLSGSGTRVNDSGGTYVAWCWKANGGTTSSNGEGDITSTVQANTDAGFSIVSYTGNGTDDQTVGHGLTAKCDLVIIKDRSSADKWLVQLPQLGDTARMVLEGTAAKTDDDTTTQAGNTTVFGIGDDNSVNKSSDNFIAYCFHSVDGFSKIGSYTGNGDAYGPIVETGFEVGWLMIKNADDTESGGASWLMYDNKRNTTNPRNTRLWANSDAAEYSADCYDVDFLANGFQIAAFCSTYGMNESGDTYLYMAFATDPDTEAPTLAGSFNIELYTGTKPDSQNVTGFGFDPNFVWLKNRDSSDFHSLLDSVRGQNVISSDSTSAEAAFTAFDFITDGFSIANSGQANESGDDFVAWAWKANDDVPTIFGGPPEAVYTFESNANDLTGMHNGTANNITYASGKFGNAAVFNGTDGDIDMPTDWESVDSIGSVSLWLYLDDDAPTNQIVLEFDNGCGLNFPSVASGKLSAQHHNANSKHTLSNSALSNNTWYHIVATFESGSTGSSELYLDGVKQSGGTVTDYLTADENTIGSRRSGEFLDGMIDQLRVFNYKLTQTEVDVLYAETSADNEDIDYGAKPMAVASINANAGFSISEMTFPGEGIIPHGLSSTPEFVILKDTSNSNDWQVFHTSNGTGKYQLLNTTDELTTRALSFSAVNATGVTNKWTNASQTWIMYSFHSVTGYSKFGTYSGGSTGSGNEITIGFQPDWIMIKRTDTADDWVIIDSVRGDGASSKRLYPNSDDDESSGADIWYPTSTGFYFESTGDSMNASGGTYIYATFKINLIMIDYLVIAGGGGGGEGRGGGGGAGGYISETSSGISAGTTYTITVGAGGGNNTSGENSVFKGSTAIGGGKGGPAGVVGNNASGGSGGGGAGLSTTTEAGAAGTAGQGYAGGHGYYTGGTQRNGGGGGGASEVGENASANTSGDGGDGIASSITGSSVTRAGGGGGGDQLSGEGTGGAGGGGNGGRDTSIAATDGTANTGSGGGGGGGTGGTGGSGIVILRLLTSDYSSTTTGSPTVTTDGDYTVLQYTSSGTYTA